jgi:hypothetical protein
MGGVLAQAGTIATSAPHSPPHHPTRRPAARIPPASISPRALPTSSYSRRKGPSGWRAQHLLSSLPFPVLSAVAEHRIQVVDRAIDIARKDEHQHKDQPGECQYLDRQPEARASTPPR